MTPPKNMKKKSVRLTIYDWEALDNFVRGDLDCMDEDCEVKQHMRRILKTIIEAITRP